MLHAHPTTPGARRRGTAWLRAAAVTLLVAAGLAVLPASPAAAAEVLTVTKDAPAQVLVGEPADVRLTALNAGDTPEYNLTFRDVLADGVTYVAGSTRPAELGEPQVIVRGDGRQVLIWANVSDLPVGAEQEVRFQVVPDVSALPVRSSFDNVGDVYASADPRTVPKFDTEGDYAADASAQASSNTTTTTVTAIEVEKLEPSPEHELVRGVHQHPTTYTLRVTNNQHHADADVVLVDYLPAQLEFLGCGDADNTPGGAVEYAGAPRLDVSTPDVAGCVAPFSVDTVDSTTDPDAPGGGVYTRVEWRLADFTAGEVRDVVYAAGIPQRANTLAFGGGAPAPESLGQAANLDNNTGASTRETGTEQTLTNHVRVSADYQGPVAGGGPEVGDTDELTVTAEDLAVQKSVTPDTFDQGGIATYTLELQTGEYADATDVVLTDVIPNGLCPLGAAGSNYAAGTPAECEGSAGTAPSQAFDTVTENADGTFTVVFSPFDLAHDGTATITYRARMLETYRGPGTDPTVVGDAYTNVVELTGTTTTLASVDAPGGVTAETVQDRSQATIHSDTVALDKLIQPNTTTPYTCSATASDYQQSASLPPAQTTFGEGSRVCFLLRIDFPAGNETKNAVLTDFLPDYLDYEAGSAVPMPGNEVTTDFDDTDLTFTLGDPIGANRFVPRGQTFLYRISGIVVRSAGGSTPDVPGNLAKLRWTNTDGVVGFLRDREDFRVPPPPPATLVKAAERITATAPGTPGPLAENATVREGDVVEFTVTVGNGEAPGAAPQRTVVGPDVWDRLPAGLTCADISAISGPGVCLDPADLTPPAPSLPSYSGDDVRSVIRWDLPDTVRLEPGDTQALTYRVTYPATVAATRSYRNDADVASYSTDTNLGTLVPHLPANNVDDRVDPADEDGPRAHDDHTLVTPQAGVTKTNTTDVADAGQGTSGSVHYAAIGEHVTYVVEATLPADTTVYAGVLRDAPPAGIRIDAVTYDYRADPGDPFGPLPGGWTTTSPPAAAQVTLPASLPIGSTADTVRMTISATVVDHPANGHNQVRTNTARFTSEDELGNALATRQATSSITTVSPQPAPLKSVDDDTPVAGQTITFTVTARNANPGNLAQLRPVLHDAELVDCVPAELAVVAASPSVTVGTISVGAAGTNGCAAGRTPVVWQVGDLAWRSPADAAGVDPWPVLTYDAVVDPSAAGAATYTNTAALTGYSLDAGHPDRVSLTQTATETVVVPAAGLSKTVTPNRVPVGDQATYTISTTLPQDVNFYDATIVDQLPSGIDPATVTFVSATCDYAGGGACTPVPAAGDALTPDGQAHGWFLGDIASDPQDRTISLTYTAVVEDVPGNVAGTSLVNTARLRWNLTDQVPTGQPSPTDTFDGGTTPGTATVTVSEPDLAIAKSVDDATPVPGDTFTYEVVVTNATGATVSTAHGIDVEDAVPAGVRVLPGTISNGGVLAGATPAGGTITWSDLGPLAPGASVTLTYDAQLASPAPSATQTNTADITEYTSLPGDGRVYDGPTDTADVTPGLPEVEVDKTVLDAAPAYRGEPVRWQIVVTNNGDAVAHDVDVVDTLPADWTYVVGAQVSVAGGPAAGREPDDVSGDPSVLTWDDLGDLAPGESLTVVLRAQPDADAPVGASVAHVNDATATAQDLDGPSGSVVTSDDDDAQTRIDSADLTLDKQAVGTPVAGAPFSWTLTVTNDGPDTATGPFTVTDDFPADVSSVTADGPGWTCPAPGPADTAVVCQRTDPTDTLASGASFPDITVTATVDVDITAGTDLVNAADVTGHTHDPDLSNNEDDTTTVVTVESDMGIDKSLVGTLVPGSTATYRIAVENAGPSPAYGAVVVTDTLPTGTTFDSFTGAGWDLSRSGQDLTFTWTGATPVPLGAMPDIVVVVDVASGLTGAITNTADVTEPTDPTSGPEEPDTDSVTSTPVPSADLGIEKASVGDFKAGEQGVYEFTVTNFGPSDAAGPITVTDTLPASLTYVSASSTDGWSCSATGQDLTCTRAGALVDGDDATFRVTVDIDETLTGDVTNTATVAGSTPDPNPGNDSDDDDTGIDVETDLSIVKTLVTSPVVAGENVTYELAVHNDGAATSPGTITVTDALPTGLTFVSATGTGWSCSAAAGLVTCDRAASLASGADAPVITVVAQVDSGVGTTTLTNVASVDGPATDPTPGNNTDDAETPVTEDTEISVTKAVTGPNPVTAGTNATFEVVVSSSGPSDARGVTVTDLLPAGTTLVSASGSGWTCTAGVCTRDRVVAGSSAPPLTVVARVASGTPGGSSLTNNVSVVTTTPGDTPAGNTDDATVDVVTAADLALEKSHSGRAVAGTATTFTIAVRNLGPSDSAGPTTVVDQLPAGMSFLSASAPWTCAPDAGDTSVVRCTLPGGLVAGATAPTLSLQVMVGSTVAVGTLTNTATVFSPTPDPNAGNDTDTAAVAVDRLADLAVVKSHEGMVRVGDTLTFTLQVTNAGPSQARDVVVTDELPSGLDFVSATGPGWTCSREAAVVSCALDGPLAAGGAAAPVSVVVGITPLAYPGVTNIAEVTSSTTDPDPADNTDSDTVEVPPLVDLQVEKRHVGRLVVGEEGTYEIAVRNDGPTAAPGPVTVTDALPDGLRLVSASGTGWACDEAGATVTCVLADGLESGASATVRVVVDVLPAAYPSVVNTATVGSPAEETDPPGDDDNTSTDDGDVRAVSELALEKEVVRSNARTVTYRIAVTNLGPSRTVRPITVSDPMPDGLRLTDVHGAGWSCTSAPSGAECVHADAIPAGAERSLTLTARITAEPGTDIVNVATASGSGGKVSDDAPFEVAGGGDDTGNGDGDGDGSGPGGLLPDTGGPAGLLLPLGVLLVVGGLGLLVRRRRS